MLLHLGYLYLLRFRRPLIGVSVYQILQHSQKWFYSKQCPIDYCLTQQYLILLLCTRQLLQSVAYNLVNCCCNLLFVLRTFQITLARQQDAFSGKVLPFRSLVFKQEILQKSLNTASWDDWRIVCLNN